MKLTSIPLSTGKNDNDVEESDFKGARDETPNSGHTTSDSLEQDFSTSSISQAGAGYWKHRKEVQEKLARQSYTGIKSLTAPHLQALTQLVENYCEAIEETTSFSRAKAQQQIAEQASTEAAPDQKDVYAMIVGSEDAMDACALKNRQLTLAESPTASADILTELAMSSFPDVREAVADHQLCPITIRMMLAGDEHIEVRFALAENHNMPFQVLEKLSQDDNPYVAHRAERTMRRVLFDNVICLEIPGDEDDEQATAIG